MTTETRQSGLPRQTYAESIFFDDTMLGHLGVINGLKQFGKRYLAAENFMIHIDEILEAVRQEFLINRNTKEVCKLSLNERAVFECKQIWHHNTFIGHFRSRRHPEKIIGRKFYYTKSEIDEDKKKGIMPSEIETNPSLKNLKPRRPPTTNPLWVNIRESVDMRYGWEGYSVQDMALIGGFVYKFVNGMQPMFKSKDELHHCKSKFVSHNYFDTKMELLMSRWNKPATTLYINSKRMIMDTKIHGKTLNDDETYKEDSIIE